MTDQQPLLVRPHHGERDTYRRSAGLLSKTLGMLAHFVWHRHARPDDHFWCIPADPRRDFDCILSDAFRELEDRRRVMAEAGMKIAVWDEVEET